MPNVWIAWIMGLLGLGGGLAPAVAATDPGPERRPDPFERGTRLAQKYTPPEPLSAQAGMTAEIERLVARGELPIEAHTFRPVDRGELAAWLRESRGSASAARTRLTAVLREEIERDLIPGTDPAARFRHPAKISLFEDEEQRLWAAPYVRVMPVFEEGRTGAWTDSSRIGLRAGYAYGARFVLSAGLFVAEVADGRTFADPLIAGTDVILHEEEATASLRLGPLRLRAGRDRHGWGPGASGTLLLSDAAEPFNFTEYQVRMGSRIRGLALYGATNVHQHRYLAAHRITWTPRHNLSLSLSEAARFQSESNHLLYAVGFMPYTLVERLDFQDSAGDSARDRQRNNVLWDVEAVWRPYPGWLLYSELLADDIATTNSEQPTRGALQIGVTHAPRWRDWDWTLGIEYTRTSNYTYSVYYQDLCRCDWEHQGKPLGFAFGPDSEVWLARALVDPHPAWGGRAWARRVRSGEGRIGLAWHPSDSGCSEEQSHCGRVKAWSLSGTVETQTALGGAVHFKPSALLQVALWGEVERTRRPGHQADAPSRTLVRGGLQLSLGLH